MEADLLIRIPLTPYRIPHYNLPRLPRSKSGSPFVSRKALTTIKLLLFALAILPLWYGAILSRFPLGTFPPEEDKTPRQFSPLEGVITSARRIMRAVTGDVGVNDPRNLVGTLESFLCDRSSSLTDYCIVQGDVRVNYRTGEIVPLATNPDTSQRKEALKPYPRKWDAPVMDTITEQVIHSVDAWRGKSGSNQTSGGEPNLDAEEKIASVLGRRTLHGESELGYDKEPGSAYRCTAYRDGPAVLFSAGGYSGGIFHDFNEVFLPLFQTAQVKTQILIAGKCLPELLTYLNQGSIYRNEGRSEITNQGILTWQDSFHRLFLPIRAPHLNSLTATECPCRSSKQARCLAEPTCKHTSSLSSALVSIPKSDICRPFRL
jgi:hypothetical protein